MAKSTDDYLAALFADSYKREIDADESIWRSLPFFGAALGLAITLIPSTLQHLPALDHSVTSVLTYVAFTLSLASFAWAFRWFWSVVRLRDYQYLAKDDAIREYAAQLAEYHAELGRAGDDLDETVRAELKAYMIEQLALATSRNRDNNSARMEARSQVLLFLMIGFGFTFVSQATMFLGTSLGQNDGRQIEAVKPNAASADSAAAADCQRRCKADSPLGNAADGSREVTANKATPQPKAAPQRPAPPQPQLLKRNDPTLDSRKPS